MGMERAFFESGDMLTQKRLFVTPQTLTVPQQNNSFVCME
jgi:hypothetical protein